jgi:hypothetical protein
MGSSPESRVALPRPEAAGLCVSIENASAACRADSTGTEILLRELRNDTEGELDITRWLEWFLVCLGRAFDRTETILARHAMPRRESVGHRA